MSEKHREAAREIVVGQRIIFANHGGPAVLIDIIASALAKAEREGMERAYLAGFAASGEGWNGEYPFSDHAGSPLDDDDWCEMRDRFITEILSEAGKGE